MQLNNDILLMQGAVSGKDLPTAIHAGRQTVAGVAAREGEAGQHAPSLFRDDLDRALHARSGQDADKPVDKHPDGWGAGQDAPLHITADDGAEPIAATVGQTPASTISQAPTRPADAVGFTLTENRPAGLPGTPPADPVAGTGNQQLTKLDTGQPDIPAGPGTTNARQSAPGDKPVAAHEPAAGSTGQSPSQPRVAAGSPVSDPQLTSSAETARPHDTDTLRSAVAAGIRQHTRQPAPAIPEPAAGRQPGQHGARDIQQLLSGLNNRPVDPDVAIPRPAVATGVPAGPDASAPGHIPATGQQVTGPGGAPELPGWLHALSQSSGSAKTHDPKSGNTRGHGPVMPAQPSPAGDKSGMADRQPVSGQGFHPALGADDALLSLRIGQPPRQDHALPPESPRSLTAPAAQADTGADLSLFSTQDTGAVKTPTGGSESRALFTVQTPVFNAPQWQAEVGDRIRFLSRNEIASAELKLHPEELGTIEIKISTRDDQTTVNFFTRNPQARELIEASLPRLRDILGNSGLQLEHGDVSQHTMAEHSQHQSRTGGQAIPGIPGGDEPADSGEIFFRPPPHRGNLSLVDHYV